MDTLKAQISVHPSTEYRINQNLDLFDTASLSTLATQAWSGRQLKFCCSPELNLKEQRALPVRLCEDEYPGWIDLQSLVFLQPAEHPYRPVSLTPEHVSARLPQVMAFMQTALQQANVYLWGGTLGPNFDCSGLMQRAFAQAGIWLPRDAYQQEAFTQPLVNPGTSAADLVSVLQPGDLIFFGLAEKANHVALYLGESQYIHSSGTDQGRNQIGIDYLSAQGDLVTQTYYSQIRGAGRVISSYQPAPT
ncbi:MAG: C40 family peptidase [Acaryochloris sp. RU_4_1]|nr:C40 family peptidase [Acaryochloris sp. SU_5_25]NJM65151.1 C40 family peptidase [Acaryochloris sp. RU_4_1]NJN39498.1 C40 family peptidase [Acaryochloridaceae cyanobacterium CSU_3_4]NJR54047.1 C40 family peptidase [Acaryochloris sp. CRU_2_0]